MSYKKLIALFFFGIAFGLLEAIVVFYLQTIIGHRVTELTQPTQYTVLLNLKFIAFILPRNPMLKNTHITSVEMFRELATIIMLVSLGYVAGNTIKQRIGAFLITFALWDIFYYVFLYVLIGWPTNLLNIDVYFLIPVPWIGPVLTPVSISLIMLFYGVKLYVAQEIR